MKPVAIFRHVALEGPGYFGTFLTQRGIPWQLIRVDEGERLPGEVTAFSGLVFMGGPMSVNDDLPWLPSAFEAVRRAAAADIPLLGHCLGGQLIAKALGATIAKAPVKELGWGEVTVADHPLAREWFGEIHRFDTFHWHGESFALPQGATLALSSAHCQNQAYVLGKHLGMQCHVEMTEDMVRAWSAAGTGEIRAALASPAVQSADAMQQNLSERVRALHAVADVLYGHWIQGLAD